jgi:acetyl-CoA synthetase
VTDPGLPRLEGRSYEELRSRFALEVPERFNLASSCLDRHPDLAAAMIAVGADGRVRRYSFGDIGRLAGALAGTFRELGLERGDRVAVQLPQSPEVAITHMAAYKAGLIVVPLSYLFGPDGLSYRLGDSGARILVTDRAGLDRLDGIWGDLPDLQHVILSEPSGSRDGRLLEFDRASSGPSLETAATGADDPATLLYTSGTTGRPKGALLPQRALLGNLPGFCLSHEFFPQGADLFWSPADWAWAGGLFDALLPTWFCGRCIVSAPIGHFDPEWAYRLMAEHGVRNTFLFPTALKMMRQSGLQPPPAVRLRSVASGGEALGEEILAWGRETLGLTINEFYGQTEANLFVGNCASRWPVRAGSMGRPYPGFDVQVQSGEGVPVPAGEVGEVVLGTPSPNQFLGYWRQPEATAAKHRSGWLLTGDLARLDEDGYLWFEGRADDIILSAGYRIGPTDIEDCLMRHPAVAMAAVIGVPDPVRTQAIKAYVVLRTGIEARAELEDALRQHVKARLAAYQYPRQFEFVTELPMTTTGKIRRVELRRLDALRGGT